MTVELSTYASFIAPVNGDDVPAFIGSAAYALDRSESGLAKLMGVTRAAVSNWKVRKTLPEQHLKWFQSPEFVEAVLMLNSVGTVKTQHPGIPVILRLCKQTEFAPFGKADAPQFEAISRHFVGLCALALFLLMRCHLIDDRGQEVPIADRIEADGDAYFSLAADRLGHLLERMGHLA